MNFQGQTCISVNEEVRPWHSPVTVRSRQATSSISTFQRRKTVIFSDTGASFAVPPVCPRTERLCQDGKKALAQGIRAVRAGAPLKGIGQNIERFAIKRGYSLIRNLASHGVGRSLHEEPEMIPTWNDPRDHRRLHEGLVFTIERSSRLARILLMSLTTVGPF